MRHVYVALRLEQLSKHTRRLCTVGLRGGVAFAAGCGPHPRASDLEFGGVGRLIILDLHRLSITTVGSNAIAQSSQKAKLRVSTMHR